MSDEPDYTYNQELVCTICGEMPCEWFVYRERLVAEADRLVLRSPQGLPIDQDGNPIDNAKIRKSLYQMVTYFKYGHLGRGNRIPINACVIVGIRMLFPDANHHYMGYLEE